MISVCMASFNGALYIKNQIDSILSQLGPDDELIISDDSSTDSTTEIIRSISDERIKLFDKNLFRNPVGNFENALNKATGDFIFLCDQDDVWQNNKVNVLLGQLITCDLVTSDCNIVDEQLKLISPSYLKSVSAKTGLMRNLFLKTSPYMGCCMAFNRKVLIKSLPFPKKIANHDYWIAMVAETFFIPKIISEPLVLYRRHSQNVSSTGGKSENSLIQKIRKRIIIIASLIKRITLWS